MTRDDLEARTVAFAVNISSYCDAIRTVAGGKGPVEQLLDCATSVGANYRATSRARSRREFVARLGVVAEEADETVYWLEFFERTNRGSSDTVAALLQEAMELRSIFAASYRTARSRNRRPDE